MSLSDNAQEILETLWLRREEGESPTLLSALEKSPAFDELSQMGCVGVADGEARLTERGLREAAGAIRRHRLAERLMADILDVREGALDEASCQFEHILHSGLEDKVCRLLGHPGVCPHGKPIPPGRCCGAKRTMVSTVVVNLTELAAGERGRITFIKPKDHARLHRLTSFGLTPGTVVQLHQKSPAFCIRFEGTELAIDRDVAEDIFVARMES